MPQQPAQPAPAAPPAPAPTPAPSTISRFDFYQGQLPQGGYGMTEDAFRRIIEGDTALDQQAALVAQQRIIVRIVDMNLVVADIPASMDAVTSLAREFGGWVITSERSSRHQAIMSIRVPATRLDEALARVRGLAVEVESERSTSEDVTDEYVDTQARLNNLQATEAALVRLLDRAANVDQALSVQRELTRVQEEIERLQGRIKLLEETAAFSRINISLRLAPGEMEVAAGPDRTAAVGQPVRFQATFTPPEGIDSFTFEWDFGDGSQPVRATRTAPTLREGQRVTSVVTHQYYDEESSPFIARITITGTGPAGLVEGEDTVIITVSRIPTIEVFAGDNKVVEAGQEVEFVGSFTRPEGLTDLTFQWEFGDGSAPVAGDLPEGVTTATATHVYVNHRPMPYTATLKVMGRSEAGNTEASSTVSVWVRQPEGWVVTGWSFEESGKAAVRALSAVGLGLGTFAMWAAIFSPVWVIGGAVLYLLGRQVRRRRA